MNTYIKKYFSALIFLSVSLCMFAQGYNTEKMALTNFLVRMYKSAPFEGVRVVEDYEHHYLLSVLSLDPKKYNSESTMNRVAGVKAMSQASRFFNGSRITDSLIIRTTEQADGQTSTEIIEQINENSIGYVNALEQLTNFPDERGNRVFIYYKMID
jgi:hypothetical protein